MAGISLNGVSFCLREATKAAQGNLPLVCLQEVPRKNVAGDVGGFGQDSHQAEARAGFQGPAACQGVAEGCKVGQGCG